MFGNNAVMSMNKEICIMTLLKMHFIKFYNDVTSRFEELSQATSDNPESTRSGGLSPAEKDLL